MLIKVKEENRDTIKILGLYLPLEGINKNNRYCRKHIIPLIRKWENKKQKIIIMGDMNAIIGEEDHWTTKTLKRKKKANHEMLNALLNREEESWGDTYKKFNEHNRKYTYTKYENKKDKEDPLLIEEHYMATRIDHIIVTPNLIGKILKSNIIQKHYIHTDHNSIKCIIQINGNIVSTKYQQVNEETYTCKYRDKNLT